MPVNWRLRRTIAGNYGSRTRLDALVAILAPALDARLPLEKLTWHRVGRPPSCALDGAVIARLRAMRERGASYASIARAASVALSTVYRALTRTAP